MSLAFPIKYYKFSLMKSYKLYLLEIVLIFTFGVFPSLIIAVMSGYQFIGFPPVCFTRSPNVFFYVTVFPVSIVSMIGICLLFGALWFLHRVRLITIINAFL